MRMIFCLLLVSLGCSAVGPAISETDEPVDDSEFGSGGLIETDQPGVQDGSGGVVTVDASGGAVGSGGAESTGGWVGGVGGSVVFGTGGALSSGGAFGSGGFGAGGAVVPVDSDGDGVPDSSDQCPGADDIQDLNENGEIDECEQGWCRYSRNPAHDDCRDAASNQWVCLMIFDSSFDLDREPGDCLQCPSYTYNCNGDPSDLCEVITFGAHPCPP